MVMSLTREKCGGGGGRAGHLFSHGVEKLLWVFHEIESGTDEGDLSRDDRGLWTNRCIRLLGRCVDLFIKARKVPSTSLALGR